MMKWGQLNKCNFLKPVFFLKIFLYFYTDCTVVSDAFLFCFGHFFFFQSQKQQLNMKKNRLSWAIELVSIFLSIVWTHGLHLKAHTWWTRKLSIVVLVKKYVLSLGWNSETPSLILRKIIGLQLRCKKFRINYKTDFSFKSF